MTASKREQIMSAIATALVGTAGVGTRVYRSRVEPMARAETPAIVVEPATITYEQNTSLPKLDATLRVRVVVIVRGNVPDQIADPAIVDLHGRIMADLTLGGVAIDVQPALTTFNLVEADQPAGVISCEYDVLYRTAVGDLTA
jgi:hypothetical protein